MELVLSFFILLILILGVIFLKIKVYANNLDLELIKKDLKKADYDIKAGIYFFGFIKIIGFRIRNGFVEFLFVKKEIRELINSDLYLNNIKPLIDKMPKSKVVEKVCNSNIKLEDFKLNLNFGTDSVIITSILVGILSGIIASMMQAYLEKFNKEKYKWKILPNYKEELFITLRASLKLSYSPILNKIAKNERINL